MARTSALSARSRDFASCCRLRRADPESATGCRRNRTAVPPRSARLLPDNRGLRLRKDRQACSRAQPRPAGRTTGHRTSIAPGQKSPRHRKRRPVLRGWHAPRERILRRLTGETLSVPARRQSHSPRCALGWQFRRDAVPRSIALAALAPPDEASPRNRLSPADRTRSSRSSSGPMERPQSWTSRSSATFRAWPQTPIRT